jgi:hypothetical protein
MAGRRSAQQWAEVRRYRPKYLLPTPGPHWTADLLSAADLQSLADLPSAARLVPLREARRSLAGLGPELLAELSGPARRSCLAEPRQRSVQVLEDQTSDYRRWAMDFHAPPRQPRMAARPEPGPDPTLPRDRPVGRHRAEGPRRRC